MVREFLPVPSGSVDGGTTGAKQINMVPSYVTEAAVLPRGLVDIDVGKLEENRYSSKKGSVYTDQYVDCHAVPCWSRLKKPKFFLSEKFEINYHFYMINNPHKS